MSQLMQRRLWMSLAILCAIASTLLLLSYMVISPRHMMTDMGGDTGKNYFSFIYHAAYDHGVWFHGMNYPYGDNIIYADGQPVLSTLLNMCCHVTPRQALGIMNFLIAISYVLAIVYTYKILLQFGVHPFLAIIFACLINITAPQVMRARSHFALAYLCVIPMLFYWNMLYHNTQLRRYPLYILLLGIFASFVHLYFGAIILLWLIFYVVGFILLPGINIMHPRKYIWPLVFTMIGIFLAIKIGITLTDPVTDRPALPYNDLGYVTHIKDMITSPYVPQWEYIKDHKIFTRISEQGSEGYSYLGVVSIVVLLISVPQLLFRKWNNMSDRMIPGQQVFPPIWIFAGFCSLLLCMGVPFIWHLKSLLNYLSVFRQFRSFGRFSWLFYYIVSIYVVVILSHWYRTIVRTGKTFRAYALIIVSMLIWCIEASGYISYTRGYMNENKDVADRFFNSGMQSWPDYLAVHRHSVAGFQGIITLPFVAIGSEKLWVGENPGPTLGIGMSAATQTRLPVVDFNMSRTSWSLTERQVRIVGGPYTEKPVLHTIPGEKPILLLHCNTEKLTTDEAYLFSASDFIGHEFNCDIYAFYPDRLLALDGRTHDSMISLLPFLHGDSCIRNTGQWYVDHYDNDKSVPHFFGAGGARPVKETEKVIANIPMRSRYDGQLYELSCWFLVPDRDFRSPGITIRLLDSTGNAIDSVDALTKYSTDNYGLWFRDAKYFAMPAACRSVSLTILNDPNPAYISMDELMMRPADAIIITHTSDGKSMVNNHLLK